MKMINSIVNYLRNKKEEVVMAMATVYVTLIIAGRRTFSQVPKNLQAMVKADLEAMGLDENGHPLV